MKLFHWKYTKVNQQYASGSIIVMAEDLDQARAIAMRQIEHAESISGYNMADLKADFTGKPDGDDWAEDQKARYDNIIRILLDDLAKEPLVYDVPTAIFIDGSE